MITLRQLITPLIENNTSQLSSTAIPLLKALSADKRTQSIEFNQFKLDSRELSDNDVFVLLKSQTQPIDKSRQYIEAASHKAAFIISEIPLNDLKFNLMDLKCEIIEFPAIRSILGSLIQQNLVQRKSTTQTFDNQTDSPNDDISVVKRLPRVVAVTGTNGKTTITQLLAQLCQSQDSTTAVMGTAGNGRLGHLKQASHTTGDALAVQTFLHQMADEGVDILAVEASSHGLDQQRLQGVPIEVAIYTNLSRDHLDYHPDMEAYAAAKAMLFDRAHFPSLTHAIINLDDEYAPLMLQSAAESGLQVWTYSIDASKFATFKAAQINPSLDGVGIELISDFGTVWLNSPLLGRFNVANLLAAIAGAMTMGVPLCKMPSLVQQLKGADGRMQRVKAVTHTFKPESINKNEVNKQTVVNKQIVNKQTVNQETVDQLIDDNHSQGCFIVDYAHTPDALIQVLTSLKPHCEGSLWAVFGCGGGRDRGKRKLMAQAGLDYADKVVFTSDNPRHEDPEQILLDMQEAVSEDQESKIQVIADRRDAIHYAVANANANDIVVIAGKGHETYQEINGIRHDFDDRVVLEQALTPQLITD